MHNDHEQPPVLSVLSLSNKATVDRVGEQEGSRDMIFSEEAALQSPLDVVATAGSLRRLLVINVYATTL